MPFFRCDLGGGKGVSEVTLSIGLSNISRASDNYSYASATAYIYVDGVLMGSVSTGSSVNNNKSATTSNSTVVSLEQ